jgi:predicted dehydrogenase
MVHKATHHFDLVNWWLSSVPETVCAAGQRRFYTPETANLMGLERRTEHCHTCPENRRCPSALRMPEYPDMPKRMPALPLLTT